MNFNINENENLKHYFYHHCLLRTQTLIYDGYQRQLVIKFSFLKYTLIDWSIQNSRFTGMVKQNFAHIYLHTHTFAHIYMHLTEIYNVYKSILQQ